ncbi:MAG: UDP-N-acetylglucosamine 2-epimerase (non-hydrolyzing) [Dehalococcoidia bacterium]
MKIVTVVGARPQFVKAVMLSRELRKHHEEVLVHTGQHYDRKLSGVFFDDLNIPPPDYDLGIGSGTHAGQTGKIMVGIEEVLLSEKPDWVLVYGDTNSTLAGALAAAKIQIPVAHVEAGPRMFDKSVPEEVNRVLTDHISSLLFAPTQTSVDNLAREGICEGVYLPGDIMLDSFLHFSEIAERSSKILDELGLVRGEYLLATAHRARNTDIEENLRNIADSFLGVDERVVFPMHPRTEKCARSYGLFDKLGNAPNILLVDPVSYLDSIILTRNARMVLTDSGGLQKEAYFSRVPCVTLDTSTGWPETVEDGWNTLAGSNKEAIIEAIRHFSPKGRQRDVFGDGKAAEGIVRGLTESQAAGRVLKQS